MVTDVSSEHQSGSPSSGASAPSWAEELLDVLEARRNVLIASAVGLSVVGILAAVFAPGFVPPRGLVGAAVGIAVVLLSVAITVAADSADLIVRGPRHVRAAGGRIAATLPMGARFDEADGLAGAIDQRAEAGGRHWVALAPASRDVRGISDWADALGVCLSRRDRRVVVIDLYSGSTPGRAGVLEVVHDEVRLARAVDFDRELMLARLGAGADAVAALESLPGLVPRLPRDIEILVVALPPLGQPGALSVAGTLDRVLVFAETDQTTRVDLIASLDALDATDTASEVVLLEPARRTRAVPGASVEEAPEPVIDEPEASEPVVDEPVMDEPVVDEPVVDEPAMDEPVAETEPVVADGAYGTGDDDASDEVPPLRTVEERHAEHLARLERETAVDAPVETPVVAGPELPQPPAPDQRHDELDEDLDAEADLRATALLHHVAAESDGIPAEAAVPPVPPTDGLDLQPWPTTDEPSPVEPEPQPEPELSTASAHADTHEILPEPIRDAEPALDPQDRHLPTAPEPEPDLPSVVATPTVEVGAGYDESRDHLSEAGRWAAPAGHEVLTGAAVERPRYDDDDDPLRVAAALQTLAQEVWSRDDERA